MEEEEEGGNNGFPYFRPLLSLQTKQNNENRTNKFPNRRLENGSKLPTKLGVEFQGKFANIPLEDVDSFYEGTYVEINGKLRIHRFSSSNSLWLFSPFNPIRKMGIVVMMHDLFSWLVIVTVAINCFRMALPNGEGSVWLAWELSFMTIYTIEMVVKVIGRGFVLDRFTYLRDPWNVLDFVILLLAYGQLLILRHDQGYNELCALRVFKIIANFEGLKGAFERVVVIFKEMTDVIILTLLTLSVFAIVGVYFYMGLLTQKCILNFNGNSTGGISWRDWNSNKSNWLGHGEEAYSYYPICGNVTGSGACPEGYTCLQGYGSNPEYGYTSYDNFFWAMLATIRMLKLDFWEALYQQVLRAGGPWNKVYFGGVMFLCSFYMLALVFGVVGFAISRQVERKRKEKEEDYRRQQQERVRNVSILDWIGRCWSGCTDKLCVWDDCFPACCTTFRRWVGLIVLDPFAAVFMTLVLITDTYLMCLVHYGVTENYYLLKTIMFGNKICNQIYILEFLLKIVALGPKPYLANNWQKLECLIVFDSILWILFVDAAGLISLHVLVILRLAQYWPNFRQLLRHVTRYFKGELFCMAIIFQLLLCTFAIFGMHGLGDAYHSRMHLFPDEELPRWNFVDFGHSFLVVYRSILGEWIESMWDCLLVNGQWWVPLFFIVVVVVGNMFALAFFIRIYYKVITTPEEDEEEEETTPNKLLEAVNRVRGWFGWRGSYEIGKRKEEQRASPAAAAAAAAAEEDEIALNRTASMEEEEEATKQPPELPVSSIWGKVRRFLYHKYFNLVMIFVIVAASVILALQDIHVTRATATVIFAVDVVFLVIITLEVMLRIGANGVVNYFTTTPWHWLDIVVVIVSILGCVLGEDDHWDLRALRSMRLLMILSRVESLKVVVETVCQVGIRIFPLVQACAVFWLVFAVTGVFELNGKFHKCIDPYDGVRPDHRVIHHKQECLANNLTWQNSAMNFDSVGNAYFSLFMVSTFKGWIGIMNDAADAARQVDDQPQREINFGIYPFFFSFIVFGVFLCLSWLLGEAVKEMNEQRKKKKKESKSTGGLSVFMSDMELAYAAAQRVRSREGKRSIIPPPKGVCQSFIFSMCHSKWFELALAMWMAAYLFLSALYHYENLPKVWYWFDSIVELLFVLIISLECVLKIIAYRRHYFSDWSHRFDLFVAMASLVSLVLAEVVGGHLYADASALCIFRAGKVVVGYLSGVRRGMRTLLLTIGKSLSEVKAASVVLFIVICVYSTCGMLAFKHVKLRGGLDDLNNFETFHQSFVVMLQVATAAGWDGILDGLWNDEDCLGLWGRHGDGGEFSRGDCGLPSFFVVPFLVSFMVICFFLVGFMFLTVILEYFYEVSHEKLLVGLTGEDYRRFDEVWGYFDPDGSGYMRREQLAEFLDKVKEPLRIPKGDDELEIERLGVPVVLGGLVNCEDVLTVLIKRHYEKNNAL